MQTTRRRLVAVVMVLGLVAAACSSGRSGSSDDGGSTDTTTAAAEAASFGDLASPCGPAEGTNTATGDQGVTADSVTIGYGDDAGYQAAPGLNKEMSEAVKAMIGWCNDQGGINGRTVVGNYYDAAILNATNVMTEACGQVVHARRRGLGPRRWSGGDSGRLRSAPGARLHGERDGGPRTDDVRRRAQSGGPHPHRQRRPLRPDLSRRGQEGSASSTPTSPPTSRSPRRSRRPIPSGGGTSSAPASRPTPSPASPNGPPTSRS